MNLSNILPETLIRQRKYTILVACQEFDRREGFHEELKQQGVSLLTCCNFTIATEMLENHTVDLIISDSFMSDPEAFPFCRKVKQHPQRSHIPLILYTRDQIDEEEMNLAKSIGINGHLTKVEAADLLAILHEMRESPDSYMESTQALNFDEDGFRSAHNALLVKRLRARLEKLEKATHALHEENGERGAVQHLYRNFFEEASIAIMVFEKGNLININREAAKLLGFTKEQLSGLTSLPLELGDHKPEQGIPLQDITSGEYGLRRGNGEVLDIEITVNRISDPTQPQTILYIKDITVEKKLRQQLMNSEKMTLMGRLAGGIAHEIRNPLAAVSMNLQYLLQVIEQTSPHRESIDAALEGAHRINQVIENTLNLARSKPPLLQQEELNTITSHALRFMTVLAQRKHLTIETIFEPQLPPIRADARQIQQVIINLLQNAIDVSDQGGKIALTTARYQTEGESDTGRVILSIRDFGAGIPAEQLQHLFEPLWTTKSGGTGLGLTLCKHILDGHNAQISLEPAPEGGTIARVIFPTQKPNEGTE